MPQKCFGLQQTGRVSGVSLYASKLSLPPRSVAFLPASKHFSHRSMYCTTRVRTTQYSAVCCTYMQYSAVCMKEDEEDVLYFTYVQSG